MKTRRFVIIGLAALGTTDGIINIIGDQSHCCLSRVSNLCASYRIGPMTICINPLKGRDVNWLHFTIKVWPGFLISDIRALWRSALTARVFECRKLKM